MILGADFHQIPTERGGVTRNYKLSFNKQLLLLLTFLLLMMPRLKSTVATGRDTWWRLGVDGPWRTPQLYLSSSSALTEEDPSTITSNEGGPPIRFCLAAQGPLSPGQLKLCYLYPDHMPSVSRGARQGLQECQWQFRQRRWNCSFVTTDSTLSGSTGGSNILEGSYQSGKNNSRTTEIVTITEDDDNYNSENYEDNSSTDDRNNTSSRFRRRRADGGSNDSKLNPTGGSSVVKAIHDLTALDNELIPPGDSPLFGHVMDIASPEAAFTHAVLSAGVSHVISRACREGELSTCGCSPRPRPKSLPEDWLWGGCGDNTMYGYRFTQSFVDIREREKNYPRHSRQLARMLMNLHNNEAGRRAVYSYSKVACKCHGVSGSCSLRTCWNQLAPFRQTGDRLKMKYDSATQVKFNQQGTYLMQKNRKFNKPTKEDLIYLDASPDYCQADPRTGHPGTAGRRCDRNSMGIEGCGLLCCGRGYNSRDLLVTERCQCKFEWCCKVKCKTCQKVISEDTCK